MHLKTLLKRVVYDLFALASKDQYLYIYCFCKKTLKGISPNNWGDDFNFVLIEVLSGQKVFPVNNSIFFKKTQRPVYACIGSILGSRNFDWLPSLEVWGSGFKHSDDAVMVKPARIHSVRGPLTREIYLRHEIDCPEIYGDPGLLVSRIYKPVQDKKYKLGIIAHYHHKESPILKEFIAVHPECLLIDMRNYSDWHEIPDAICSCEKVLSSSLHALIVADSYGIPNKWFSIPGLRNEDDFKFLDYFASVGREVNHSLSISYVCTLEKEIHESEGYEEAKNIDYQRIIDACPFCNEVGKNQRKISKYLII